jgi:sugar/nucleoside kinase (ribokinase family)
MNVLGIGEIVLDNVCLLPAFLSEGEKIQPLKSEFSLGGPVPAALILLAHLGVDCLFIGSFGRDNYGEMMIKRLKKENVSVSPHYIARSKISTVLINQLNGSRSIIRHTIKHSPICAISKNSIRKADIILLDRHETEILNDIKLYKQKDAKVIIDPSTEISEKTFSMMQIADYPILPIESLQKVRKHESLKSNLTYLYHLLNKSIIITAGEKGSFIFNGTRVQIAPSYQVKVIDTLGAGDVYRGAFAYGLLQKWSLLRTIRFANSVSALQCTKFGNDCAIPSRREIEEFKKHAHCNRISASELYVNQINDEN